MHSMYTKIGTLTLMNMFYNVKEKKLDIQLGCDKNEAKNMKFTIF